MHMADALLTPSTGALMWCAAGTLLAWSTRRLKKQMESYRVPLMGVMGAFVFAAQMINFTIPGTGSSGHLGGGLLLAAVLGPHAAFLTLASVLTVQALFFADGGLLALGCNIFNLGFFPCFIVYPFIFRPIVRQGTNPSRLMVASVLSAVLALQLGAFNVVLQTVVSGVSALPFKSFAMLMQPIHFVIGCVEGMVTAGVLSFILREKPELLSAFPASDNHSSTANKRLIAAIGLTALLLGGIASWVASEKPDGLEWAIEKVSETHQLTSSSNAIKDSLNSFQSKTALMPDYTLDSENETKNAEVSLSAKQTRSIAGVVGGGVTLVVIFLVGLFLRKKVPENPMPGKY